MVANKSTKQNIKENSYFHALIGITITFFISIIIVFFILHNNEIDQRIREIIVGFITSIIVGFFAYIISKINKLLVLLNTHSNIIEKIDQYVDNRIRKFYLKLINNWNKNEDLENFRDFIVEITEQHVFKNPLPTLADIETSDYKDIIEAALNKSSNKIFYATLSDFTPDWFFDTAVNPEFPVSQRKGYLKKMDSPDFHSCRLMIFEENKLRESFNNMTKKNKDDFFSYHKNTELYWISEEDYNSVTEHYIHEISDCAVIDYKIGLQKEGKILRMLFGESIKSLNEVFRKLDEDKKNGLINTEDSYFKDKEQIIASFQDNFKEE